jgi:DNA-directed RNA polymerase specialized sigma subunit
MDDIIRRHKSQKQGRVYFTKETEKAIVKYNRSSDPEERSELYQNHIHWPFYKLTENIIHTFKFYYTDGVENLEDLQHEIMVFLLSKIHLFNPDNGAKAYSYFGTIVKRWLIVYNQKNYGKKIKNVPVSDLNNYSQLDTSDPSFIVSNNREGDIGFIVQEEEFSNRNLSENKDYKYEDRLSLFIDQYIKYCTDRIYVLFPKGNDATIADAILELFRKRDNIDVFNKKALYIYIREMVDVKTPKITKIADKLHDIFKSQYIFYLENGYAKF